MSYLTHHLGPRIEYAPRPAGIREKRRRPGTVARTLLGTVRRAPRPGLDPDDPAIIAAIDLVPWDSRSALESPQPPDRSPKPNRSAAHDSPQNCPAFCDIGPLSGPQNCPPHMARPGSIRNQSRRPSFMVPPTQTGNGHINPECKCEGPQKLSACIVLNGGLPCTTISFPLINTSA